MSNDDPVVRSHRPGHIGDTPQDTSAILSSARIVGQMRDFGEHLEPDPRINGYMGYPNVAAEPGYFRDDTTALQIMDAATRLAAGPTWDMPTAKTLGGYDPAED